MTRRLVVALLASSPVLAAEPVVVTHTGHLIDGDDRPVTQPDTALGFRLYALEAGTSGLVWSAECRANVQRGYYAVLLGGETCAGDGLDDGDFPAGAERWLEVRIDGVALTPRLRVNAVPLASVAARAGVADALGAGCTGCVKTAHLEQVGTAGAQGPKVVTDAAGRVVSSGGLTAADVPELAATKLTSGRLEAARLPANAVLADSARLSVASDGVVSHVVADELDFGCVGCVTPAQVGPLPAAKIGSGRLDYDRLPEDAVVADGVRVQVGADGLVTRVTADALTGPLDGSQLVDRSVGPAKLVRGGSEGDVLTSRGAGADPEWKRPGGGLVETTAPLTDAGSIAVDAATARVFTVTLAGNRQLANPTGLVDGARYLFRLRQDGTGGRTVTWGTAFRFPHGVRPVLSAIPNALDLAEFTSDGTNLHLLHFVPNLTDADASSCRSLRQGGVSADGAYTVLIGGTPTPVYCDMTTDGGGWMLVFNSTTFGIGPNYILSASDLGSGYHDPTSAFRMRVDRWGAFNELRFWCRNASSAQADAKVPVTPTVRNQLVNAKDTQVPWTSPILLGTATTIGQNAIWPGSFSGEFQQYASGEQAFDSTSSGSWGGWWSLSYDQGTAECNASNNSNDSSGRAFRIWVRH